MRFGILKPTAFVTPTTEAKKREEEVVAGPLGRDQYHKIEAQIGYTFQDPSRLEHALTHRSAPGRREKNDYERLEFLGDAVLDLAVAHLLIEGHTEAKEGDLSKMRAALVNATALAEIARSMNLGPFIRLSRGELANGGADRASILSDVFESIMGAVYLEAGFPTVLECVRKMLGGSISSVTPRDPKTELQEALHAAGSGVPEYLLECVEGPEHSPIFVTLVRVDGQVVGRGRGTTKKASQQFAASEALERLRFGDDLDQQFLVAVSTPRPVTAAA